MNMPVSFIIRFGIIMIDTVAIIGYFRFFRSLNSSTCAGCFSRFHIFTDFYPTFLELAGIDLMPKQHQDGVSILPLLRGEQILYDRSLFWHYPHYGNQGGTPGSSIRKGNYKLIEFFEDSHVELYDLKEDIEEKIDISKKFPQITENMKTLLEEWRKSVEAKIPEKNPKYNNLR